MHPQSSGPTRQDTPISSDAEALHVERIVGKTVGEAVSMAAHAKDHGEDIFRLIAETVTESIFCTAADGRCVYVNRRFCEYTGLTFEQCMGSGWQSGIHAEDLVRCMEKMANASRRGEGYETEQRIRGADGVYRWFLMRAHPLKSPEGAVEKWIGTCTDIDDLTRAQRELAQEHQRYTAFIQQSSEAIWRCELRVPLPVTLAVEAQVEAFFRDGYLAECNDAMAAMYGMSSADEIVGADLSKLLVKEDPKNTEFLTEFVRSGYRMEDAESVETDKDGNVKYFINNFVGVVENGFLLRAWGMQRDVTRQKESQRKLVESEERYHLAAQAGQVGVWDWKVGTDELYISPDLREMLGYDDKQLPDLLSAWCDLVHPDDVAPTIAATNAHLEGKVPVYETEVRRRHKNGEYLWFLARGTAVRDAGGKPVRLTGADTNITQRKKAEQARRESDERLRLALNAGNIGAWDWDIAGGKVEWSERVYEFHGREPGSFSGEVDEFVTMVHPDDREWVGKAIQDAVEKDVPYDVEFRVVWPDGSVHWISTSARVIRDEAGKPLRMLGATMDVTDHHEADVRIRASEESLRFALRAGKLVAWSWNAADGAVKVSDNAAEVLGIDASSKLRADFATACIHPEDGFNHHLAVASGASRPNGEYVSQFRFIRPDDGRCIWIEDRGRVTVDETGAITAVGGVIQDITDRREAEEAIKSLNAHLEQKVAERTRNLQATLQRIKQMIARLPIGVVALDEHDIILEANDVFCEIFDIGPTPEGLIGKSGWEFSEPFRRKIADPAAHGEKMKKLLAEKKAALNQEMNFKDGRIIQWDFIPIAENGEYHGQVALYRDVTRERRIDATKSEFMSLASHQLRTPLTAVRWTMGRLQKSLGERSTDFERHLLGEGRKAALRMTETIDTMLQISRIEAGTVQLGMNEVAMRSFLDDITKQFGDEVSMKSQTVRLECAEGLVVRTDPNLLQEIVFNLLGNAIKYTPEGGAIGLRVTEEGECVRMDVTDTGYGIPAHQQAKIFQKFFRGDNVVTKDTQGTGLGLHLVALMTQLLGGKVSFVSQEGKGTTFTLLLPTAPADARRIPGA